MKQYEEKWQQCIERDSSDQCIRCGNQGELLHHCNGDNRDHRIENLVILCRSCNKLKSLQKKHLPVSRRDYTPEHKKNLIKEPLFRKFLEEKIQENNYHYPLDFVIDEGAFIVGISPETIKRYLSKVCDHPSSPYITRAGAYGEMDVWQRDKAPQEN